MVAALVGLVVALIVGLSTLRLSGIYFVIFTFGLSRIRQMHAWCRRSTSTARSAFISDITQSVIYWQLLTLAVAVLIVGWLIARSRLGLAARVIGEDENGCAPRRHRHHTRKAHAVRDQRGLHDVVGAVMAPRWIYRSGNRVQSDAVVSGGDHGAIGRRRHCGPSPRRRAARVPVRVLSANFPNSFSILLGIVFMVIVYLLPQGVVTLCKSIGRAASEPCRHRPHTAAAEDPRASRHTADG